MEIHIFPAERILHHTSIQDITEKVVGLQTRGQRERDRVSGYNVQGDYNKLPN